MGLADSRFHYLCFSTKNQAEPYMSKLTNRKRLKIDVFIVFGNGIFSLNGSKSDNPLLHLAKIKESHQFIL